MVNGYSKGNFLSRNRTLRNGSICHVGIGPIYTHAASAAYFPDSPDSPDNPDNPDSKAITPSAAFPLCNPLWRNPIYTRAASAAHLPDSPENPDNPDNPDSEALHLQPPLTAKNCQLKNPIRKAPHHGALLLIIFLYFLISFRPAERWKPGRTGCNGGGKRGLRRSRDPWQ